MTRAEATANYKKANAAERAAECMGHEQDFCEATYNAACEARTEALRQMVALEIANPTKKETKKENEILRLRNRGWDV